MKVLGILLLVTTALCGNVTLPAYHLAVKSPYLSTWFPGADSAEFPTTKPFFWTRVPLTWFVAAHVNKETYCLLGCSDGTYGDLVQPAKQQDIHWTSTHTYVTLQAGDVSFTLDFFSPVSTDDYVRQSIPYSYLTVSANKVKKGDTVDILSAIDQTWTAQNVTEASFSQTKSSSIFKISGKNSIPLTEKKDMATYGSVILAASSKYGKISHQTASAEDIFKQVSKSGSLDSNSGTEYGSGNIVALSYRLQNCAKLPSVTFAVGFERSPTIMWLDKPQAAYYQSKLDSTADVVDHFFADLPEAQRESQALDAKVRKLGTTISENYADVLEAHVAQIWGGFELTVPMDTKDTSKAKVFIKEISTDGNVQTLADLIPKALPALYILAPEYIRLMLEPIMEYTLQWPANFAFHDLRKSYPNATGETVANQEQLIIDQTAVIHWMIYSYIKRSGNYDWVKPYLRPLQNYADYLVQNGLYPPSQRSSVDSIGPTPNQTVLAIYSAIGLTSFGAYSGMHNYTAVGMEYAPKIIKMGLSSDGSHIKAHYNDSDTSWISTYPFAFDSMLGLGTFNKSIWQTQSAWYSDRIHKYGMQFYDGVDYTVAELSLWCAATSSNDVRSRLINALHAEMTSNLNVIVGGTQWNVTGGIGEGKWFFSTAKSIVGSYFMPSAVMLR